MASSSVFKSKLSRFAGSITSPVEKKLTRILLSVFNKYLQKNAIPDLRLYVEESVERYLQSKQQSWRQQFLNPLIQSELYIPTDIMAGSVDGPYMLASNPLARDFLHPELAEFCRLFCHPIMTHRKLWEWAFIFHHVRQAEAIRAGSRGLGFGVGTEQLPSLFASLGVQVTATDCPTDPWGWHESYEHSNSRDQLFVPSIISRALFDERVSFQPVDMNDIPNELSGFDFCWSSCALEHLGSLQHGIDFIINSVEKTLKIGGVACHTTELNLTSDAETLDSGRTVIYRMQDLKRLWQTLEERGHKVNPLRIEPGHLPADYLVDVPPYRKDPHLKLQLEQYITTSVGIVARRGR